MASGFAELTAQAQALVAAGDLTRARELLGPPLRGADPSPGNASPELAEAAGLQARVLVALGDAHSARGWAAFAYSAATRLYGPADQRTVGTAATLAAVLHRVGSHARAARLYRDVIIELTATDGPESLRVLAAHADLATVEYAQGECTLARNRLEDAWELHREVYGDGHIAGIRMLARLGSMQRDCGLFTEAHEHLALARELCREHLPADHPLAAQIGALARAAANPDHVCTDAAPGTTRHVPQVPPARSGPAAGSADPSTGAPGEPDRPTSPAGRYEPTASQYEASQYESPASQYEPPARQYGSGSSAQPSGGYPLETEHPPDADLPPLEDLPPLRYPTAPGPPWSAAQSSATSVPQVPPPRLPPAPPVESAPRWASPPRPADRPPVPPPRTAGGRGMSGSGAGSGPQDRDGEDLDPEHGWWPPEVARRHPDDDPDDELAMDPGGSGWSGDVGSTMPPGVPALGPGAGSSPEPPGGFSDGLDEADGVRRIRNLPERRSSRLPVRIHRIQPSTGRLPVIIVAGLVVLVLLGTVAVVVGFGLTDGDGSEQQQPVPSANVPATPSSAAPSTPVPAASPGTPPGNVTLADDRSGVTLAWTYPAGAEGPVVVSGGRAGQELRAFEELPGGSTGYVVYGLETRTNYCFSVAVVYSVAVVGRAEPVCTERPGASPGAR
ncbi:tetratricopeptide (TPR) repeat protein [Plantactinospora soyae]|uniref:Tetratricopeptide (TPR) repeat protein n=1 Tax=Plantactinospora soyae TaxID=1544732 RepID=A0A927MCL3_9ACTN|nr:tetratricopeptide repeat protein [Plantactinospora soyae]MBE1488620.1 tetratricopeptide (TPR) repeat protein [Plantactinospora soyae]